MYVKETGVCFNTSLNIGKFGYSITMDDYGVNIDIKDLIKHRHECASKSTKLAFEIDGYG